VRGTMKMYAYVSLICLEQENLPILVFEGSNNNDTDVILHITGGK